MTSCLPCAPNYIQPNSGESTCDQYCVPPSYSNSDNTVCLLQPGDTLPPTTAAPTTAPPTQSPPPTDSPWMDGGAKMDPHIQKWDGIWFDFNGQCDLVLLKSPNFDGTGRDLTVQVRTVIRSTYSFISDAAIQIDDSTLEFSSWGQFSWDGIAMDADRDLSADPTFAGFQLVYEKQDKKSHSFTVRFDNQNKIVVSSFKDFVNVNVHMKKDMLKQSVVLMGNVKSGESLARDGKTVMTDANEFGQEWQVRADEENLFIVDREPKAPQKCMMPELREQRPDTAEEAILRQAANKTCDKWARQNKVACVADIMATGNLEFAKSGVY